MSARFEDGGDGHAGAPQGWHKRPLQSVRLRRLTRCGLGPRDDQLLLSVPRLGLEDVLIGDSSEQAYLDWEGIMRLSGTDFPNQRDSNRSIVSHAEEYNTSRIPHVFRNLKDLRPGYRYYPPRRYGGTHDYRVYERFVVTPYDFWVTEPVPDKQIDSLQTWFPDPTFENRFIVRDKLVS